MGTKNSLPRVEDDDTIILRSQLAEIISQKRVKRRKVYASMVHRVLSTDEYINLSFASSISVFD